MKEKSLALLICIITALSILGFTYSQWNDVIIVSTTMTFGDLNMGFVDPLTWTEHHTDPATGQLVPGEYLGKDVGKCECYYTDQVTDIDTGKEANKTLIIAITNAYPDYEVHCNFTVENIGKLPLHINETAVSDPDGVLTWDPVQGALLDGYGNPIINLVITPRIICNKLEPEDDPATPWLDNKAEFELAILLTQNAQECHVYTFQVKIVYEVA